MVHFMSPPSQVEQTDARETIITNSGPTRIEVLSASQTGFSLFLITSFGRHYTYIDETLWKRGKMEHEMTLFHAIEPIKK